LSEKLKDFYQNFGLSSIVMLIMLHLVDP